METAQRRLHLGFASRSTRRQPIVGTGDFAVRHAAHTRPHFLSAVARYHFNLIRLMGKPRPGTVFPLAQLFRQHRGLVGDGGRVEKIEQVEIDVQSLAYAR